MVVIKNTIMNIFKEVSAYDFIASQGEQEWLPKYGEEAMFSDNKEDWIKTKFNTYIPRIDYPFVTAKNIRLTSFKYYKPLLKQVSFTQFLKDNNCYKQYMFNCKIENQRWSLSGSYTQLSELKKCSPDSWVTDAFNFRLQKEVSNFWESIVKKWQYICKDKEAIWENEDENR